MWTELNKSQFARSVGIVENYWIMFENGDRLISLAQARKLTAVYGLSLDWIFDGVVTDRMPAGLRDYITKKHH
jgi:transcriptional regulator with XRE-family HTH domain